MIEGGEVLLTMAEIAVGLAGFSGVVAAFGKSRDFPAEDQIRFLFLVGGAFFVIFLSLCPLVLDLAGIEVPRLWRWSSGIWLGAFLAAAPLVLAGRRVIVRAGRPAPTWSVVLVLATAALVAVVQVGNVIAWPYEPGPVPFLLGLMVGLLGCGVIFVYLVLIRPNERGTDGGSAPAQSPEREEMR